MAKQDKALSELQVLEGIYEHLSAIEELSARISSLSSRVSRVEERLREPMEITNPILQVGSHKPLSRNDSLYGAAVKSSEACRRLEALKTLVEDVHSGVQLNVNTISYINSLQKDQIKDGKALKEEILKIKEESSRRFKVVVRMMVSIAVILAMSIIICTIRVIK